MQLNMPNSVTSTRNQYPPHPLPVVQSPDVGLATPPTKARVADHVSSQRNNVFVETIKNCLTPEEEDLWTKIKDGKLFKSFQLR
jgi:hypothetical protein